MPTADHTLYLIDGHAQIFRAYFAIRGGMNSPVTGEPTHAVFGFAGMLLKLLGKFRPRYVAMAIDTKGPTFRDEVYPQYKATRPPPPEDFHSQEQRIFELTRMFGVPIFGQQGAEADDLIATIVQQVLDDPKLADVHVRVVSKDKDLEQLLGPRVTMFDIHTDTTIDEAALLAEKGVTPAQVVDLLALTGDNVDNIPGVAGVGPKTAAQLIQQFGSIDGIFARLDEVKGKRRENLEKARDFLPTSRHLVALKRDVEMAFDLDQARAGRIDAAAVRHLFRELGFHRHQAELERLLGGGEIVDGVAAAPKSAAAPARSAPPAKPTAAPDAFPVGLFDGLGESTTTATPQRVVPSSLSTAAQYDYQLITTHEELQQLVADLRRADCISVDTETIGLGRRAKLCGLSFAWKPGHGVYVPLCSPEAHRHLDEPAVLAALRPVLEDPAHPKCGHNIKYDMLVLRAAGVELRGVCFDSMIAAFLVGAPGLGLDDLAMSVLKHQMIPITDLIGHKQRGQLQRTMDQVPLVEIGPYASEDADAALRLRAELEPQVRALGMRELAERVEMPLVAVLADMEWTGVKVDPAVLDEQAAGLNRRIVALRDAVHEAAGVPFNIDSPKQLADVLFRQLKLPVIKRTKTGPSTDIEVLEALAEREGLDERAAKVAQLVVEYRQLTKLVGTYLVALKEAIEPATGRVHTRFHQTGAATGRLSSSDPNLQNIPIRTDVGRQIRRAFVADEGHVLVCADYSQIELRILAHLSDDPALIAAFAAGQDIHTAVATQVFATPAEQVTREQRNHAKVINFGIIYGVTPFGLARRIEGMTVDAAKTLIADYRARFAGIDRFLARCVEQAQTVGYVTTMLGRRRAVTQVSSRNPQTRALGERLAINTVVQGSAADLIKLAMVNLHARIAREGLPMRMLLQVHDELVVECPADAADTAAGVLREEMEGAMSLKVPLHTEVGVGRDWFSAKE